MDVLINEDKISEFVENIEYSKLKFNSWKSDQFIQSDEMDEIAQFFFIGNAINFKYWYESYKHEFEYGNYKGSTAMWAVIRDNPEYMDAKYLKHIDIRKEFDLARMPMAEERICALREVGNELEKRYQGRIINLCNECDWDAETIVDKIVHVFPMWEDYYQGVAFRKRACLFIAMLHGRLLPNSPLNKINKIHCLADYQVPKVLQYLGIFSYSLSLEKMIKEEKLIEYKGKYETGIRKMTIIALQKICDRLSEKGEKICPLQLDYYLWSISHNIDMPYHLTVTIAY